MRINPINFYNRKMSFGEIKSPTRGVSKEILGDNEDLYEEISDRKGLNIWTFKRTKGGMYNPSIGYIVLIQRENNGEVLKEIKGPQSELKQINKRIEQSLIWINPSQNSEISTDIKFTDAYRLNKDYGYMFAQKLSRAAMSPDAKNWEKRLDSI